MAVYVLMSFNDEDQAHEFVRDTIAGMDVPCSGDICGIWKKPTKFCECTGGGGKFAHAFTRGKKYGWWVHTKCGKPSRVKKISACEWEQALGSNLLPVELCPEPFQKRISGWDSPMMWTDLL